MDETQLQLDDPKSGDQANDTSRLMACVELLVSLAEQQSQANAELPVRVEQKLDDVSDQIENRLDALKTSIEEKLEAFDNKFNALTEKIQSLDSLPVNVPAGPAIVDPPTVAAESTAPPKKKRVKPQPVAGSSTGQEGEAMSEWERQKQSILAELSAEGGDAFDDDYDLGFDEFEDSVDGLGHDIGLDDLSSTISSKSECETLRAHGLDIEREDEELEALHESIECIDESQASEDIMSLKEELTGKLREAEVELSINRAKLSQQWAELERKQHEIDQRESLLASKYQTTGNESASDGKSRLLDRFTRHLSRGDSK